MTKYKVLVAKEGLEGTIYVPLSGEWEAANDEAAIKAAIVSGNGDGDPSGEYVAVPVRSFKVHKVEAKQAYSFS